MPAIRSGESVLKPRERQAPPGGNFASEAFPVVDSLQRVYFISPSEIWWKKKRAASSLEMKYVCNSATRLT